MGPRPRADGWPALLLLPLLGLTLFFWPVLVSRFELLPGVLGDTRFNNAVLEHWWQLLRRGGDWRTVPMFHPVTGTLAYSDTLLLFVPFYGAARAAGLAPYHALAVTVAGLLLLGYASAVWLFRRVLSLPPWIAALAAFLHAFAASRLAHYGQVQLFAAMFVPVLLGLALGLARRLRAGQPGSGVAIALALGLAALLLTSFYVGWFAVVFLGITGGVLAAQVAAERPRAPVRRALVSAALLAGTFLLAALPLLRLYLPHYAALGGRRWEAVAPTLPAAVDFVNVGRSNWVWGRAVQALAPAGRPMDWELSYGIPPALLLLFLVTTAALGPARRRGWLGGAAALPGARFAGAMGIAVVVVWLSMLAIGEISLWRAVHAWAPGAAVIRGVFRFQTVLLLGVVAVAAFGLAGLWRAAARSAPRRALVLALAAFLILEQVDTGHPMFDGVAETRALQAWSPPPAACTSFLLLADPGVDRSWDATQLDAVMLALRVGLPTLNGYSGDGPPDWTLRDPRASDYLRQAARWVAARGLGPGLCTADAAGATWRLVRPSAPPLAGVNLITRTPDSLEEALGLRLSGFHDLEAAGRWTDGQARITLAPAAAARAVRMDGRHDAPTRGPVRVLVNGRPRFSEALPRGPFSIALPVDAPVEVIEIASDTFVPQQWQVNQDRRRLGVFVSRVALE